MIGEGIARELGGRIGGFILLCLVFISHIFIRITGIGLSFLHIHAGFRSVREPLEQMIAAG